MLDPHVDGYNVAGRSEPPAGDVLPSNVPKVQTNSPIVQTQKSGVERCTASILQDSFETDYSLPNLPIKSLMTHTDIMGKLREQGQVRDFLGLKSASHLERASELSKDDACPVPYFIPELEMYCARAEAGHLKELAVEEPNPLEVEGLEPKEDCPSQIEEISISKIEEQKVLEVEAARLQEIHVPEEISIPKIEEQNVLEFEATRLQEIHVPEIKKVEDINITNLEEPEAPEMAGPSGLENAPEQLPTIPVIEEPTSSIIIDQGPIQILEPMATIIEKPMPVRETGFLSSLIGVKPIWRPSVRLCFGDRERKRTPLEEEIKQQTSKALKALILNINLYKTFKESSQEKKQISPLKRSRGTLTYSGVFEQSVLQQTAARLNRQKEFPDALACGEPIHRNPVRIRVLDASDGWDRSAPDSDSSDSCDSDDSGIRTTLSLASFSREIMKMKQPIADRQDIESSGRILFSKPVTLFRFNSVKQWKREGHPQSPNEHPYTGNIQILERHGLYYILLREKNSAFLLVYTRIDGNWNISYMTNTTDSCGWFNFNYAYCAEGTPEHFACTFQEPSHAAEFVARVRNIVIKARFLD